MLRYSTRSLCVDDDDADELSLALLDLSSVGFSCAGGKAGAGVRCLLRLPRRGAFGTRSQGTPCISGNSGASERFVGSSLRIVLAPVAPFIVPLSQQCARGLFLSYLLKFHSPTQCLLHGVSFLMTIHDVLVPRS